MAESMRKSADVFPAAQAEDDAPAGEWDEAERTLGRAVALGLPVASVLGAILVGFVASLGSGLLVLAAGALLGAITLVWVSVRTLSGDAPLAAGFQELAAKRHGVDALSEDKRRVLRALKDLENEHELGKIRRRRLRRDRRPLPGRREIADASHGPPGRAAERRRRAEGTRAPGTTRARRASHEGRARLCVDPGGRARATDVLELLHLERAGRGILQAVRRAALGRGDKR